MINFSFSLVNPWSDRFKNLWCRSFNTPVKNKFIEMEVLKDNSILSFHFHLTARQSQSGLDLEMGVLGYSFNFKFYDCRHWDYQNGRYETYDDAGNLI